MNQTAPVEIPYGYASPEDNLAYVVGPQGKIHMLDITTGTSIAQTTFAAIPLTFNAKSLIGWAPSATSGAALSLFMFKQKGKELIPHWETFLQLPYWVDVNSSEADAFELHAKLEQNDLIITWEAHSRYSGGAPPPPGIQNQAEHDERHTLRFDAETGVQHEGDQAENLAGHTQIEKQTQKQAQRVNAMLSRTQQPPGLTLKRQTSESEDESELQIKLSDSPSADATITPDGALIFVHDPEDKSSNWRVIAADSGEEVSTLPYEEGTRQAAVVNENVLYLVEEVQGSQQQLSLRCRNLKSKELLWSTNLEKDVVKTAPPLPP